MHDYERFGDILLRQGSVKKKDLNEALAIQRTNGGLLGEIMVAQGFASEDAIAAALAAQFWYPLADLDASKPEPEALKLIPPDVALARLVLPLTVTADEFHCVIADPLDITGTDWIQRRAARRVVFMFASRTKLVKAIRDAYGPAPRLAAPGDGIVPVRVSLTRKPKVEPQLDRQMLLESLMEPPRELENSATTLRKAV